MPQFVVTIAGGALPAERLLEAVERVLGGPLFDLVVRLELPADHPGRAWLERQLGPDPRVRVATSAGGESSALEEFPASSFQVTLPAGRRLPGNVVGRLRAALGTAVLARCDFPDGSRASITRSWALHRAARTRWEVSDFGAVVTIPPRHLRAGVLARVPVRALGAMWERLRAELRRIDGPRAAWRFVRWFRAGAANWAVRRLRAIRRRASRSFLP